MHIDQVQTTSFVIDESKSIKNALSLIEHNESGIIFVTQDNKVIGCVTDGDIRRALLKDIPLDTPISACTNHQFIKFYDSEFTIEQALKHLDAHIRVIPVLNAHNELINIISSKTIAQRLEYRQISKGKSPVRISFAGGGTDLTDYFSANNGGAVLNTTINKYAFSMVEKRNDSKIILNSQDLDQQEVLEHLEDIQYNGTLDLLKAVIKLIKPTFGFELTTRSEVPVGSGLGGSAVLVASMIGALNTFLNRHYDYYEIAELAFQAERIELGLAGGWQDQYATVFGGFNFIEFTSTENIVHPLRIANETLWELEDSLILCYTGKTHNSSDIHQDQKKTMKQSDVKSYAEQLKALAYNMKSKLLKNKLDDFGYLLHEGWELKKQFSSHITSKELDNHYEFARQHGALGGKLLGAGGGGYFLFFVPSLRRRQLTQALANEGFKIDHFNFDPHGLRTWTQ